jgi:hypothetical protein
MPRETRSPLGAAESPPIHARTIAANLRNGTPFKKNINMD